MALSNNLPSIFVPFILLVGAWLAKRYRATSRLPFPPGPKPRFLTGNLRDLPIAQPWITYTEWGKQYGDIVHASAFGSHVLVVNSSKVAVELFERRARIYSDRPDIAMLPLMGWDFNFTFLPYGEKWRQYRKLFNQHFRRGAITTYRPVQLRKIHDLLRGLLSTPEEFDAHIKTVAAAVIMATVYGHDIQPTHDKFVDLAEETVKRLCESVFPGAFAVNTFPVLRHLPAWLPGCSFQRYAQDTSDLIDEMKNAPFDFVRQSMREGVGRSSVLAELLDHHDAHDGSKEQEGIIKDVTAVAYAAAADTTSSTLVTFIMEMALHPEVVQKAQDEIDAVTGLNRLPGFEDRSALPYCEAVYREVMRHMPIVPLGVPHATSEDDIYEGYFIPKGWHYGHWQYLGHAPRRIRIFKPRKVQPERFLNAAGQVNPPDSTISFGFGRRICPGRHVADATVWAVIVSILSTFNIAKAKDANGQNIEIEATFTDELVSHPHPFKCAITPRSHVAKRLIEEAATNF